jgi:hypothetical protein
MKKRTFFILFGCVLIWILALALGLGLGLGLGLKKNDDSYVCRLIPQPHLLDMLTCAKERRQGRSVLSPKAGVLHWRFTQCQLFLQEGCL